MPFIPALRRQRQADLCEFEATLVYRASSRTGSNATEKPCLENLKKKKKEKEKRKTKKSFLKLGFNGLKKN